MVKKTRENRNL